MISQLFNSSVYSGPEALVLPNIAGMQPRSMVINLCETRISGKDDPLREHCDRLGLEFLSIPVKSRIDSHAIQQLRQTLKSKGIRILHCHDVKATTYGYLASRNTDRVCISTHHGVRGRKGFVAKTYEWFYANFVLRRSGLALCVCQSDRDILIERGLSPDRVLLHQNGVDRPETLLGERAEKAKSLRTAWNIPEEDVVYLGFVGRLAPEKRVDRILNVLSIVDKEARDIKWKLICFGKGASLDLLKNQAKKLGIDNRVEWMGYRKEIGNEFAGFDITLSFSDAEGLPINLIESGWAATPVFGTHVDGVKDLIPNTDFGLTFEPTEPDAEVASRLINYMRQPESHRRHGEAFQSRVKSCFSKDSWCEQLNSIYKNALR